MRWLALWLFLLLPVAAWAQDATSEEDRGFLTSFLEDNLSGLGRTVRIDGFSGALSSRATFTQMTIADAEGVWLTITDGALSWDRRALLSGRVEVRELSAASIEMPRLPRPEAGVSAEAPGFSLPDLPVSVNIGQIRAERVVLGAPVLGQVATVSLSGSLSLAGGEGTADLSVRRTDGPKGDITLRAAYGNTSRRLALDLLVDEGPDGIVANLVDLPDRPALTLAVHGDGIIDTFRADVALSTDGQRRLSGTLAATSTPVEGEPLPQRGFHADFSGDVTALFRPEYRRFFGSDVRLVATGRRDPDGQTALSELSIEAQALKLSGQALLATDGLPRKLDVRIDLGLPDRSEVLLPTASERTWIRNGQLRLTFDAAKGDDWTLSGSLAGLRQEALRIGQFLLDGSGSIRRVDGSRPQVSGALRFGATGIAPADPALAQAVGRVMSGHLRFDWQDGAPLRLDDMVLSAAGVALSGAATVSDPQSGGIVTGRAEARIADLGRFSGLAGRDLGGSAEATISGTAGVMSGEVDMDISAEGTDLRLSQPEADRLLAGVSQIALSLRRGPDGTQIRSLRIGARTLTAEAEGWLRTGGSDVSARLSFTDLSALGAQYGGSLEAAARLTGSGAVNRLTLSGTGNGLRIGQAEADGLLRGRSALTLTASEQAGRIAIETFGLSNPQVALQVSGTVDRNSGAQDLTARLALSDMAAMGPRYGGTLNAEATVSGIKGARRLMLTGQGQSLRVGQDDVDRLLGGTIDLSLAAREDRSAVLLESLSLRTAQLTAEATGRDVDGRQQVDLSARLANMAVLVPEFPGPVTVSGRATHQGQAWSLDLSGTGPGNTSARVAGTLSDGGVADLSIAGEAQAGLANAFLGRRNIAGPVSFDLRLQGQPSPAALSGRIEATGLRITDPDLAMAFENARVTIDLTGPEAQVSAQGTAAGGGSLAISGPIALTAPYDADLTLQLDGVRLHDPDLFSTTADGNLTIRGPLQGGAMIAGAIDLGQTEVRVPTSGFGGFADIEPIRHIAPPADVTATRQRAGLDAPADGSGSGGVGPGGGFGLDVQVNAPNRIFVRGRGLDAELGGSLRLTGSTANVVPIGDFTLIRGRLNLLGKRFDIDEGRLSLEGALTPYVLFIAATQTEDLTVSIRIEGPASEPEITFESSPQLPQEEIVAQLLFGRGLDSLSVFQAAQLASAIATLTGRGGEGIVSRLRSSFGLDDLDVQTDENGGLAVRAGKYITSNVYTDITIGGEGTTEINLNLDVSKNVTVRGTLGSDGNTGIGVYYERDY